MRLRHGLMKGESIGFRVVQGGGFMGRGSRARVQGT